MSYTVYYLSKLTFQSFIVGEMPMIMFLNAVSYFIMLVSFNP